MTSAMLDEMTQVLGEGRRLLLQAFAVLAPCDGCRGRCSISCRNYARTELVREIGLYLPAAINNLPELLRLARLGLEVDGASATLRPLAEEECENGIEAIGETCAEHSLDATWDEPDYRFHHWCGPCIAKAALAPSDQPGAVAPKAVAVSAAAPREEGTRSAETDRLLRLAVQRKEEEDRKLAAMSPAARDRYIKEWAAALAPQLVEAGTAYDRWASGGPPSPLHAEPTPPAPATKVSGDGPVGPDLKSGGPLG